MSTVELLGIPISRLNFEQALNWLQLRAQTSEGASIYFANVHTVTESNWNKTLRDAFLDSSLNLADGLPLVWYSRILGEQVGSRVCGPDYMETCLRRFPNEVFGLIGGMPGIAKRVSDNFGRQDLCWSPPIRPVTKDHVLSDLNALRSMSPNGQLPKIIWVGLGAPKQEIWIWYARALEPSVIFLGVGAAFDFLGSNKKRAPVWMQKLGLEWAFRLSQEPKRLFKRYLKTNTAFVALAFIEGLRRCFGRVRS